MEQSEYTNKQTEPEAQNTNHQNEKYSSQLSSDAQNAINPADFTALAVSLASMASSNQLIGQHDNRNANNHVAITRKSDNNIHKSNDTILHEEATFAEITKLVGQDHQSNRSSSEEISVTTQIDRYGASISRGIGSINNQTNASNFAIDNDDNSNMLMTQSTFPREQLDFNTLHNQQPSKKPNINSDDLDSTDRGLESDVANSETNEFIESSSGSKIGHEQTGHDPRQKLLSNQPQDNDVYQDTEGTSQRMTRKTPNPNVDTIVNESQRPESATSNEPENSKPASPSNGTPFRETCRFCGHVFTHPGSLGRHLDLKRGTRLHPSDQIDLIRKDVKRRGDVVEVKARRAKRARVYNSRTDVRERSRLRRKRKEREDRASNKAKELFIESIGKPTLPPHPSFAYLVLFFLPPAQWPHDPPTSQTLSLLKRKIESFFLNSETSNEPSVNTDSQQESRATNQEEAQSNLFEEYTNKVNVAFEQWTLMNKVSKMAIWSREQRRIAEAALGSLSLYDLGTRDQWIEKEKIKLVLEEEAREKPNEPEGNLKSENDYESDTRNSVLNEDDNSNSQSLEKSEQQIELNMGIECQKETDSKKLLNMKLKKGVF